MLNINDFINNGIRNIADIAGRFYANNRQGQAFMRSAFTSLRKSAKKRAQHERQGIHIPPFLIASVATECNLRCGGCYAWANGGCGEVRAQTEMSLEDWRRIFSEAADLGVSFILMAGGEPLLRRDIIELAAQFPGILFPIFTNGTLIDEAYLAFFDSFRNAIPVLSMEGTDAKTDMRRGEGISRQLRHIAEQLSERGILFGASITITRENKDEATDAGFVKSLRDQGCGLVFYVEYVPAEENTEHLSLTGDDLRALQERIDALRIDRAGRGMILLSFPGDEERMGGCLAAGRGFFHINASGGAEPCPFSPYSEMNLKEHSLAAALQSPFFERVRQIGASGALPHLGGCALFHQSDEVQNAVKGEL